MTLFSTFLLLALGCSEQPDAPSADKAGEALPQKVAAPEQDADARPESPSRSETIPRSEEGPAVDPNSCFNGTLIIGEGEHDGEVEMVGCERTLSVLMSKDDEGRYRFPRVQGHEVPPGVDVYITLAKLEGKAPIFHAIEHGKPVIEAPLHEVLKLSYMAEQGKLTPWIAPHMFPPFEVDSRQDGRLVGEGYAWSILSAEEQVKG